MGRRIGKPNGKPFAFKPGRRTKYQTIKRRELEQFKVLHEVLVAKEKQLPIDDDLFDKIGRKLGVGGKTEVKRLYAAARSEIFR